MISPEHFKSRGSNLAHEANDFSRGNFVARRWIGRYVFRAIRVRDGFVPTRQHAATFTSLLAAGVFEQLT